MDEHFMTLLNVAFTTIALKSVHRDDVKHQIQMGEENLEKLRVELVKSGSSITPALSPPYASRLQLPFFIFISVLFPYIVFERNLMSLSLYY